MTKQNIQSFDLTDSCNCYYVKPVDYSALQKWSQKPLIARGAGMSYCNATAVDDGVTIDMCSFNRILSFDNEGGFITVEAGISIGDLNNYIIGQGWQMPVLPGYPMITVGGCIAFNVHGKSVSKIGLYIDWVEEILLYHPLKGEMKCSPHANTDVFNLTIGGMGFTGIILTAKLRLRKISGNQMLIKSLKVGGINDALKVMKEENEEYEYVYSWNNFNLTGNSFGKGIVYLERIKEGFSGKVKPVKFTNRLLPHKKTPAILNKFTIYWMCQVFNLMNSLKSSITTQSLAASSFPIYGKEIYYHLFGTRGFREYQVIFSNAEWDTAIDSIKKLVSDNKMGIALASLKLFKSKTHNISFSGEGICLAMDIPNNKKSINFFSKLDEITLRHKGLVNLSKDSRAGSDLISKTYDGYYDFKKRLNDFDPDRIFVSELRNRLKV